MSEEKQERLNKIVGELNIKLSRAVEYLNAKGFAIRNDPNVKISDEQYRLLVKEFGTDIKDKKEASERNIGNNLRDNFIIDSNKPVKPNNEGEVKQSTPPPPVDKPQNVTDPIARPQIKLDGPKILGKIELPSKKNDNVSKPNPTQPTKVVQPPPAPLPPPPPAKNIVEVEAPIAEPPKPETPDIPEKVIEAKADMLKGLTVLGKIELSSEKPPVKKENGFANKNANDEAEKRKRKRIKIQGKSGHSFQPVSKDQQGFKKDFKKQNDSKPAKEEISDKDIQDQIKNTLAKLSGNKNQASRAKYRKEKRSAAADAMDEQMLQEQENSNVLKVTEFISANDLASLMSVSVNEVIKSCLSLGMFISINQRLDAEAINFITEEFGFKVEYISAEEEIAVEDNIDAPEDLEERPPIVTIMGHVDHGKTSLLDYIRKSNITSKEAGGITQHIGAYDVLTESGKYITFLDTPGHEAFTAMRARGAKVTDVVIIVVAADDGVMPQTKEAINHAMVAGVPIIIAINKIDKPAANPDKVKEQLSLENILVEDWGGKYQCEHVSAKSGMGVAELLDKVLLEAELLELKANPHRDASGTVIEASLDKGKGYVTTLLVQTGTLKVGDIVLAGQYYGKVKAMVDHKGSKMKNAGPAKPVQILGLPGAPQAGDKFNVMNSESEAREIAVKREQIHREQGLRTRKHITLDEIGRRLAIGNFKQLNIIVKADFDGSVEAISDSLLKLSTKEIQIAVIHKGVGQISESDVLLATASDAIVIGFNVRPSIGARKLADQEEIEIRFYSIIYDAINEIKDAMEGMLAPTIEEAIIGTADIKEVFRISKVGSIAGCMVQEGVIKRANEVRLIRDGIVIYTGKLGSLKRFKEDTGEVKAGLDCGMSIDGYNDIQEGDIIESFEKREIKRKLA
ncbi:MAG: translation initiation factor IF-2 [Cytophagales bacterium]|nr:translation initiation factor IF-2 [Cytophagales bacterium]